MNGGIKIGACDDAEADDGNKNVATVVVAAAVDEDVLAVSLVVITR